jgi:hypothetical protein
MIDIGVTVYNFFSRIHTPASTMLPFHRKEAKSAEKSHTAGDSKGKRFWRFFIDWWKVSWKDVLAMVVFGAAAEGVSRQPQQILGTFCHQIH